MNSTVPMVKITLMLGTLLLLLLSASSCSKKASDAVSEVETVSTATISVQATPSSIPPNGTSTITATVQDSGGNPIPDGTSVSFALSSSLIGSLSDPLVTTAGGTASTIFSAGSSSGAVTITATADGVSSFASLTVSDLNTGNHEPVGFLRVSNGQIVDETNYVVKLKGFNVSGWLLNENWINPGFLLFGGQEHELSIRSDIDAKNPGLNTIGKLFTDEYRRHFIQRGDFEYWHSLGVNMLRLNVSHFLLAGGEEGFALMDEAIGWAEELGLYIVIDLVTVPGCANQLDYCDLNKQANLWVDINNFDATVDLWTAIAQRYKEKSAVAGYNLMNEPNSGSHDTLKEAYKRLITAIRAVDQRHIIFLDGNNYAANFEVFSDGSLSALDSNLVYSFHLYSASNCNPNLNWEQTILDFVDGPIFSNVSNQTVPIWLGEYAGDCDEWLEVVHKVMKDKGVQHMSYYSPKCALGNFDNSKCLSKMATYSNWTALLQTADTGGLTPGWSADAGFTELESSNFIYNLDRLNILVNEFQ